MKHFNTLNKNSPISQQNYRRYHLLNFFDEYENQSLPLDLLLNRYFRSHKSLGVKDRGFVAETVYTMVRWKALLDAQCKGIPSWEKRFEIFENENLEILSQRTDIPIETRLSFPKSLFDLMSSSHGYDRAVELCRISNEPAPITLRANLLKITRENLLIKLKEAGCLAEPCQYSPWGINVLKRMNFFSLPEFKQGLFEVQDEGSQLLAALVRAQPGNSVLDYCAGSGGKTLAFAPSMQNKGQIHLHDIRNYILDEARKRLRRAGIQNAQIVHENDLKLKKLKKKMDWVLVDAPCSGTGTMRRNPDMKWKFTEETLTRLLGQQRVIFEKALSYLRPSGRIVYATCSLLRNENQDQIAHFLKIYNLELEGDFFEVFPSIGGMDGFFGAVLKNK